MIQGETVEVWYDRRTRSWVVQKKDGEGNQVGDAEYVYTRSEATAIVDAMRRGPKDPSRPVCRRCGKPEISVEHYYGNATKDSSRGMIHAFVPREEA